MTLGQAKKEVLMLVDEYSTRGDINTNGNTADYGLKLNSYFNLAQRHIAETKYIKRSHLISHYLPYPATAEQFESVPHSDDDVIFSAAKGYAFHFAVDGEAEVYIEGVYPDGTVVEVDAIDTRTDGGFVSHKGLIEPLSPDPFSEVRLRFAGGNYYRIKDVAIFPVRYPSKDKIPNFGRYVRYEMPHDFLMALKVDVRNRTAYEPLTAFEWENNDTLAISAFVSGDVRVEYAAKPKEITSSTPDAYRFEIGEYEQGAMLYYVAALCLQHNNFSVYSLLMQQYTEKMINARENKTLTQTRVKRVY